MGQTSDFSKKNQRAKALVAQVHSLAFVGCALAAVGARAHLDRWSFMGKPIEAGTHMYLAQVLCVTLLSFGNATHSLSGISAWKAFLFSALAFTAGVNVGSWVQVALQEAGLCRGYGWNWIPDADFIGDFLGHWSRDQCSPKAVNDLIFEAMSMTSGLYLCFALSSFYAGRGWAAKFAGFLSAGMWVLFGFSLLASFGWISKSAFDAVYVKCGLVLYSGKIMYDTDFLWSRAEQGATDVVNEACNVMLNVLHLFIRIIKLLGEAKGASKRKKRED